MKTARDRAIDIVWSIYEKPMSRTLFCQLLGDESELGKAVRDLVHHIEKGIEQDRADIRKAMAPS